MIHSTPKIVRPTVDLHENFVQVPLPIGMGALQLDTFSADLRGEQRTDTDENAKLKRLLADAMLDNVVLKDLVGKELTTPTERRRHTFSPRGKVRGIAPLSGDIMRQERQ